MLAWRISNTLEADFCVEALNEAIHRFGPPEIMNTDQGSQFTSFAWTDRLKRIGTRISMDGRGRCLDNIFIERLWRSLKYECVYLHAWETGSQAKAGVGRWITFYNHQRPHAAHGRVLGSGIAISGSQACPLGNDLKCELHEVIVQLQRGLARRLGVSVSYGREYPLVQPLADRDLLRLVPHVHDPEAP